MAGAFAGAATTAMMVVGDRPGLYDTMGRTGPVTSEELAEAAGTHERYVREWLAEQAAAHVVEHDAATGTFTLSPERAAVLAGDGPAVAMAGVGLRAAGRGPRAAGLFRNSDALLVAFRTGEGSAEASTTP